MVLIWYPQVVEKIEQTRAYYLEISDEADRNFRRNLQKTIDSIVKYPDSGKISHKRPGVLSQKVKPHWRLYFEYDEKEDTIFFYEFFDQRQDPTKLKY